MHTPRTPATPPTPPTGPGTSSGPDAPTALKKVLTTPLLYFFILGDVLGAGV
ncbi:hypothetical protein [Streptomyces sp. MMBL 11-3]|uniref:hypothetical protein n=1 Tax=Streptomyces sp. MMBL 11-3 TaxID=3382639 RepID=UPI0039B4AEE0